MSTVTSQRASSYRGKYPKRIKMVSGSKAGGLYLEANDGTAVRLDNETAWAICQALGKTKNGAQLGDDITPWLPPVYTSMQIRDNQVDAVQDASVVGNGDSCTIAQALLKIAPWATSYSSGITCWIVYRDPMAGNKSLV